MSQDNYFCWGCGARHDTLLVYCRVCKSDNIVYDGRGDDARARAAAQRPREAGRQQALLRQREEKPAAAAQRDTERATQAQSLQRKSAVQPASKRQRGAASDGQPKPVSWRLALLAFAVGFAWLSSRPGTTHEAAAVLSALGAIFVGRYYRQLVALGAIGTALYVIALS